MYQCFGKTCSVHLHDTRTSYPWIKVHGYRERRGWMNQKVQLRTPHQNICATIFALDSFFKCLLNDKVYVAFFWSSGQIRNSTSNKAGQELFPRYHHGSAALTAVASWNPNAYSIIMPRHGIWELRKVSAFFLMIIHVVCVGPGLAVNSQVTKEQWELAESVLDRGQKQKQQKQQ